MKVSASAATAAAMCEVDRPYPAQQVSWMSYGTGREVGGGETDVRYLQLLGTALSITGMTCVGDARSAVSVV